MSEENRSNRYRTVSRETVSRETVQEQAIDRALVHQLVLDWYRTQGRELPWRQTRDPYHILVAEIMLQQTQVDRVIPKYHAFLSQFPTLQRLAEAPTAEVIRAWAGLGYNRRAINLQAAAREAVESSGGQLPADLDQLRRLPGVGRYTAGAVACFAFELPEPVVDTNVKRVLARIIGLPEPLAEREAWALAERMLPEAADVYDWNQALMDLGATICDARAPACLFCPAREACATRGINRLPMVAEARAEYRPTPFKESTRWYRGKAIAALRELQPGETLSLAELGRCLKPEFGDADLTWLSGLVAGLVRDQLARDEAGRISLP